MHWRGRQRTISSNIFLAILKNEKAQP